MVCEICDSVNCDWDIADEDDKAGKGGSIGIGPFRALCIMISVMCWFPVN